jgi:hypothetical protein
MGDEIKDGRNENKTKVLARSSDKVSVSEMTTRKKGTTK